MSSQIVLSRGVADPDKSTASSSSESPTLVTSIFQSPSSHIMTLEDAIPHDVSGLDGVDSDTTAGRDAHKETKGTTRPQSDTYVHPMPIHKRKFVRSSTLFDNPNDPYGALDDNFLEPCPHGPPCNSVFEVLSGKSRKYAGVHSVIKQSLRSASHFNQIQPEDATSSGVCWPLFSSPTFPSDKETRPDLILDRLECAAVKPSLAWTDVPHSTHNARPDAASQLPTEIIQQIYDRLAPHDFNSARHTCRSWFVSSLHRQLLGIMLRRMGYSDGIQDETSGQQKIQTLSPEWLMSKRLARECALGPDVMQMAQSDSALYQICKFDFTEIEVHYPGPDLASTVFTISSCGRFLMAANGCLIYIYELNRSHKSTESTESPGLLRPVTSILCPRRVLACSMDTSSQRYAVAILLDGRMGMVCEITVLEQSSMPSSSFRPPMEESTQYSHRYSDLSSLYSSTHGNDSAWQDDFQGDMPSRLQFGQQHPEKTPVHSSSKSSMPLENGPRTLYRNLCSEDDPPRSVAICPQRRCVAFGCSSGLELHWVDALTGQDLNRWFPLTAPSDFLFFLPPRKSVDSAKKLRLISSAGRPSERTSMSSRAFGHRSLTSPFWERFGWDRSHVDDVDRDEDAALGSFLGSEQGIFTRLRIDASRSSMIGRVDCSDHYRAVPLSDGYHILFTDPASGHLCLGSDAPVGGPTKLLRKIWFHCPSSNFETGLSTAGTSTPVAYAAGSDFSHGVRVCVAFGTGPEQSIWLFSVPTDIFDASQTNKASSAANWLNAASQSEAKTNEEWINWWPDDGLQQYLGTVPDPVPGLLPRSVWPVKIRGQMIGTCKGLVDLVIDSGPKITVWAFSKAGVAKVWKIDDGKEKKMRRLMVVRDGTIREVDDSESGGDVEMTDSPEPEQPNFQPGQFDGTDSSSGIQDPKRPVHYDSNGDVLMADLLPHPRGIRRQKTPEQETVEAVFMDPMGREVFYHTETWMRRSYRDFVEELTGVARIDLEIR
ncbi:uncharacterized protein RSE6_02828 [Rhynchosporium secalis]|uniref:F-box domain-containing protein n=1 Tax=Rhynchosporium secalis TaxID=38038 RepID=A0A1E1M186_RHYSE|nr:uncharacterized protein RSE6_02828 [Rhynchosporium secalis]